MGVGTIVGSAVFNILCIIGVCGLFAGQVGVMAEGGVWEGEHGGEAVASLAEEPAQGPVILDREDVGSHAQEAGSARHLNSEALFFSLRVDEIWSSQVHVSNNQSGDMGHGYEGAMLILIVLI